MNATPGAPTPATRIPRRSRYEVPMMYAPVHAFFRSEEGTTVPAARTRPPPEGPVDKKASTVRRCSRRRSILERTGPENTDPPPSLDQAFPLSRSVFRKPRLRNSKVSLLRQTTQYTGGPIPVNTKFGRLLPFWKIRPFGFTLHSSNQFMTIDFCEQPPISPPFLHALIPNPAGPPTGPRNPAQPRMDPARPECAECNKPIPIGKKQRSRGDG